MDIWRGGCLVGDYAGGGDGMLLIFLILILLLMGGTGLKY